MGNYKNVEEELVALREELDRVRKQTSAALEAVGIGLWTMFPQQNRVLWDEQCQRIYNWPHASVRLDEFMSRIDPQDLIRMQAILAEPPSRQTGKPTTIDYRITSPVDEKVRWIRITGRVTMQASGTADYFSGTAQDITDEKRREATLQTVEQRFQMAFSNASVGVVILDTHSRIQLINKAFADLVGYDQEELHDQHFQAISHPDDVQENIFLAQQLLAEEANSYVFNKRYIRKDGSIVWAQVSSALIRDQDGKPDSFITIVQDITTELQAQAEQKKLLSLLQSSEESLRDAIELAELSTFEIDPAKDVLLLSERARDWLGFSHDERITLTQVLDTMRDRNSVEVSLNQAFSKDVGTTTDIELWAINRQTGQERLYLAQGRVVRRSPNDADLVIRGIAKDITTQKQYARELEQQVQGRTQALQQATVLVEQQADQLRFVTDSALTAIALYSIVRDEKTATVIDLRYVLINQMASRMTGIPVDRLIGKTMSEVFPGMKGSKAWHLYLELAETGTPLRYHNHYTQDGYDIWYQVQGVRQGDFLVLSFLDITELKQTQLQLEGLNKDLLTANDNLQQFAFIASHDLQEPLRKVQQFGDLLKNQYSTELGDGVTYLERMQLAAQRMSILIKDLLTFSRITTKTQTTTEIPLERVISRVVEDLDIAIQDADATVQIDSLPVIKGDESQLRQLFQNLLSNSLKFRRPDVKPDIHISAQRIAASDLPSTINMIRQSASYQLISISDNGIGFDEKYLDRIFQVFQRLHGKNQYDGTGIGLAIVQKVVSNHGGTITATSQLGQGSTFQVFLPYES
ncbi:MULTISPECIES: PAS domain-containing sensor histidine kinase [Spirosoma]|uniref:histidine kinase n=1 Tax=Spirosoma liriopis TaxID=2937440 RepID=A0ABT0HJQ4_9BACT|nr:MULTISPECIES: PAS domain S-box protein [Spirosoma]MCK8492112.1 PAS domain S-box protein [Spirosoma liriopis]UHG91533.1 PAS domain S-box protein [Spirosoma oryzicola]